MAIKETFFISHGSPMLAIDDSSPAHSFLSTFQEKVLPEKPKAILIVSAHYETSDPMVTAVSGPNETIYDFYGFPKKLYKIKVDEKTRGLDHGAWVALSLMFPAADVPVCELSVQGNVYGGDHHFRVGRALAPLKDDGVLIIGSGSATHNLNLIDRRRPDAEVSAWAKEFDGWIAAALAEGRREDVIDFMRRAPHASAAHPRAEHFYPLHVALGAAGENATAERIHDEWSHGTISYASYRFTETPKG
ncbi:hypothetical protein M569_08908 [Genlisea aurea]|uniref:Extradiol ring-cleavage dioxygenase class III enzyme subunit B domain-containing protein n=1 Tax=Genlisea aurea TaxID=192259 RepID=S8CG42_9LAMI|nr:hypothetical protein M569_08908 [Genlisea aurea]